ncbi:MULTISPECIES: hypothetical protein [unclassified Kribbella]|uniref:hypothetical protein n=1 Tax=unclassified Kribbella TaxID=2644121 RepID=UPI00301ADA0C
MREYDVSPTLDGDVGRAIGWVPAPGVDWVFAQNGDSFAAPADCAVAQNGDSSLVRGA